MEKAVKFYIKNIKIIGALYCAVPTLTYLVLSFIVVPFRNIYLLRAVISLTLGCAVSAYINHYVVHMWLLKHKSKSGPAAISDGAVLGFLTGLGLSVLPALTMLIRTNHPEEAKLAVILVIVSSALLSMILGSLFSIIGRKYL